MPTGQRRRSPRQRRPPRRRNPPAFGQTARALVEMAASETDAWALGQYHASDHDILTISFGNPMLNRAAALRLFALVLRTGKLDRKMSRRWEGLVAPRRVGAREYLEAEAEEIPLAAAMGFVAASAEAWADAMSRATRTDERTDDEQEALRALATFFRTGERPDWHRPVPEPS